MLGVARPSEDFELRIEREPGRPGVRLTIFDFVLERGERSRHDTLEAAGFGVRGGPQARGAASERQGLRCSPPRSMQGVPAVKQFWNSSELLAM
jgi:hypothetical protein